VLGDEEHDLFVELHSGLRLRQQDRNAHFHSGGWRDG
jgi:hypothetical protein